MRYIFQIKASANWTVGFTTFTIWLVAVARRIEIFIFKQYLRIQELGLKLFAFDGCVEDFGGNSICHLIAEK